MRLQARTTYVSHGGSLIHIAGLAKTPPVEGERIWWSIEGNHYSESGRFVSGAMVGPLFGERRYVRSLAPEGFSKNIVAVGEESAAWWEMVSTFVKVAA